MSGSYNHAVNSEGQLCNSEGMLAATDTQGDAYMTIEQMYGMIWYLARGDRELVEEARQRHRQGIDWSPGIEEES